jgi:hypothetical protein
MCLIRAMIMLNPWKEFKYYESYSLHMSSEPDDKKSPGPSEVFCTECGEIIKQRADICPNCGVRQNGQSSGGQGTDPQNTTVNVQQDEGTGLTDRRQYELEKVANKSTGTIILVALLLTPAAYWMMGKKTLAIVNFFTANFFLTGFIVVPIHCYVVINNAREELRKAGVAGY